jgi:hypothetical protein
MIRKMSKTQVTRCFTWTFQYWCARGQREAKSRRKSRARAYTGDALEFALGLALGETNDYRRHDPAEAADTRTRETPNRYVLCLINPMIQIVPEWARSSIDILSRTGEIVCEDQGLKEKEDSAAAPSDEGGATQAT